MIKIEKMEISGLANALYGMRLPKNSNLLSDSYCLTYNYDNGEIFTIPLNDFNSHNKILRIIIGPKDKKLAENLILAGTDHGKWFRQIQLSFLLTAPMTAWWDIDTYKVATVKNSSSRMHKITSRPLTINDFSYDDKNGKIESLLVNGIFLRLYRIQHPLFGVLELATGFYTPLNFNFHNSDKYVFLRG